MSTITFEHQIDAMSRRSLKTFIKARGRSFDDCVTLSALRTRARQAFHSPRNSRVNPELPVQTIKRKEIEKKQKQAADLAEKKKQHKKKASTGGRLITKHSRRPSSSEMTLKTEDELNERRHVSFDPKKKLGISLAPRSCEVATIRENSQAHWAGVLCGWVVNKVNGVTVDRTDVKQGLKGAIATKKTYTIDFDTMMGREKTPLPDADEVKPKGGNLVSGFVPTHSDKIPDWAGSKLPQEESWATAGGAGPRRSVMPGSNVPAPGLKEKLSQAFEEQKDIQLSGGRDRANSAATPNMSSTGVAMISALTEIAESSVEPIEEDISEPVKIEIEEPTKVDIEEPTKAEELAASPKKALSPRLSDSQPVAIMEPLADDIEL